MKGPKPPFGYDSLTAYDRKRDRIYFGGGQEKGVDQTSAPWYFDVRTRTWVNPKPKGAPGRLRYTTQSAVMNYDTANDVIVLVIHRQRPDEPGVYVYDPARNEWFKPSPPLPEPVVNKRRQRNSYYDAELNVHFIHSANDGRAGGVMHAYRYKRAKR